MVKGALTFTKLGDEVAVTIKLLKTIINRIGNVSIARTIDGNAKASIELAVARTLISPLGDEVAVTIKLLNTMITPVGNVNVA
jgi:hypothetical protein